VERRFDRKATELPADLFPAVVKTLLLQTLDLLWTDHLDTMEYLRTGIGLRGYGQRDPLVEYRQESHQLFRRLLAQFRQEAAAAFFHLALHARPTAPEAPRVQRPPLVEQHLEAARPVGELAGTAEETPRSAPRGLGVPAAAVSAGAAVLTRPPVGRNDPCPCGSGKKYKKCHGT
jgi:preprotein translocase subunit SecA